MIHRLEPESDLERYTEKFGFSKAAANNLADMHDRLLMTEA